MNHYAYVQQIYFIYTSINKLIISNLKLNIFKS